MAPISQTFMAPPTSKIDDNAVVISGMAGLYPESHNVKDLSDILYNKVNPVNKENSRWQYEHPEVAHYTGKLPELRQFDAQFFKVHYRLGNNMDAMGRKILEQAYQAIYDAGISPAELNGKKVGVYVGSCFSETEKACFYVASSRTGFGIAGCSKTMFANRISYWLNAKGPSMAIDEACISSTGALELAYLAITRGECEAAIVGGANLCLHPQSSIHYGRIMTLSMDGKTKSFDTDAAGCSKSEAINVLFLQKAKDALRVYAEVIHIKCEFTKILEDERGPRYGFYRNPSNMANFIKRFYDETKISPKEVEYVEAFGSAVTEADKAELEAIEEVYCKDRKDPLLIGSVMSNIGYGEAACGISAVTKVLLGYHTGKIAANLHCDSPRQDIPALRDGRMHVVTEHKEFGRAYTAVNGLSVTGVNAHILLDGHYKPKDPLRYKANIPQLVTLSGRQESSVKKILNDLKSRPIDYEELALFRNIHKTSIFGHLGRGFTILDTNENNETVALCEKADYFDDAARPLWFVYSGMGSQWAGMGAQLMRIPIFAAAIERCRIALEPKGIDIVNIITNPDKTTFDNILHSFVGIAAVQIGLTDILTALGIVPDKIIGHSVGELGCAYADGCFTAEEMILSAYSRGLVSLQTPFIKGSMAAVGIGYQQVSKMCPPEIEVACHNGPESSTISGPADAMKEFVAYLTSKNIFAKEVPCSNIAYHSRYIAEAGPGLLKYLSEVIKSPKARSERWVSTSVPQDRWNEPLAKYSSAEYHTNNLLNSVLFEETSTLIPSNAVVVEIAPHGLLQAILKRSLPASCKHIPLTRRGHPDNAQFLLEAIGKLYMEGYNPKVEALYPKVEYPVSTGTPMLSHLVEWAHNERWNIPLYVSAHKKRAAACKYVISTHDDENAYLKGHIIREKNIYPFAAVLVAVWDTLAMVLGVEKKQLSVEFKEVYQHSQLMLFDQRQLRLNVALHRGTGKFEVLCESIKIATGYIVGEISKDAIKINDNIKCNEMFLKSEDIYQLLHSKDYNYSGDFRSIYNADLSLSEANILWNDNWVTFIDGVLQLNVLRRNYETVSKTDYIRKIVIDVKKHKDEEILLGDGTTVFTAKIDKINDSTRCGGLYIENIRFQDLPQLNKDIAIKTLEFVPHVTKDKLDKESALFVLLQIVAENTNKRDISVVEITKNETVQSEYKEMSKLINDLPGIRVHYSTINENNVLKQSAFLADVDLLLLTNLSTDDNMTQYLQRVRSRDSFLINIEQCTPEIKSTRTSSLYHSVCIHSIGSIRLELALWRPTNLQVGISTFTIHSNSDLALLSSRLETIPLGQRLVIIASYSFYSTIKTFTKQWKGKNNSSIYFIIIKHAISDEQSLEHVQIPGFAVNILDHGIWGGEYYLPIIENPIKGKSMSLEAKNDGDLQSLYWIEAPEPRGPGIKVAVHYAGINDVEVKKKQGLIAFNKDSTKSLLDFSGVTDSGERVMGITYDESIKTRITARPDLIWPVPEYWSLEDAATVPLAYCLAFYCLNLKNKFRAGTNVLVHGGAGALGQAVISIALAYNCNVFATVSDNNKKRFLLRLFPDLKAEHIGNSRDISFADMILNATKGEGVNTIISCVRGEIKNATIRCCLPSATVVDTTVLLAREEYSLGMKHLSNGISYCTVDLFSILDLENKPELKEIQLMICEGIARGYVRPLSRMTFSPQEAPRAYRLQANSRHRGRVLLNLEDESPLVKAKITSSPDLCQWLVLDNELLGLQLAERLIKRGARKMVLICSSPSNYLTYKLRTWAGQNVNVEVVKKESFNDTNMLNLLGVDKTIGGIEGIYYVHSSEQKLDIANKTLTQLILMAQRLNNLKYFTVISNDNDGLKEQISNKSLEQLITWIKIPTLKMIGYAENKSIVSIPNAIDAIEKALSSKYRGILVHSLEESSSASLIQELASITGLNITDYTPQDVSLNDLGIDPAKYEAIRVYMRDNYFICLDDNNLQSLTIQRITELANHFVDKHYKETEGLKTFISYVDYDELLATTEMVFLPTLTNLSAKRDDEFDVNQTYMCIVPGVEGHHARFSVLCERLKLPALVLQPGLDLMKETIPEIANRYAQILLKKTQLKNGFYLLAYESGILVALEMVAILEDQGLTGTVFCIGGGPEEIQARFEEKLEDFTTEEEFQNAVIRHMFTLVANESTEKLDEVLKNTSTWNEKITECSKMLLGRVEHSNQYTRQLIEAAYTRISQVRQYIIEPRKLRSQFISLRPRSDSDRHVSSLQNYSQNPIIEYELQAPLAYSAQDLSCSALINRHLDPQILESFDKRNLCETYILNADSFMTSALNSD